MHISLRPIGEQVVVVVGASSGIGRTTARPAAERGARVVLAARNEHDLASAVDEIRARGGRAVHQVADVADAGQVERIAETAVREFGRIDTWVNAAGVGLYGKVMDVSMEDMRRQFDVIYWGTVHGSRTAVQRMGRDGGAIVNVASALADRAIPLQGNYCAAKHAVKAFTDALRMELHADGVPISITLIKPASIDTPLFQKAKSYMGVEPQPIPPVYVPEVVAEAILEAAAKPVRELIAGGAAVQLPIAEALAPGLTDRYMERKMFDTQKTDRPVGERPDNLYAPVADDGGERGRNWEGDTKDSSLYTSAVLHPRLTAVAGAVGVGVLLAGVLGARRRSEAPPAESV
ncbi:short-chain dehydrogenase/reductase SDR [Gemmatirosa kalamazoonensis]|uniref:Short-chain dehydrogenase/reductase SDR n=1 Tax=Gemmatirosa kalamazoonensis TaxID=861299 RepID=W0RMM5_9BACT|nr:SDR family oxidoreductase [Gemmatirosa kalamazoonensis]AHG91580.1 short-chain dehydrogenase/reductase SDR [Gemmatirosa kalamazoonensis]